MQSEPVSRREFLIYLGAASLVAGSGCQESPSPLPPPPSTGSPSPLAESVEQFGLVRYPEKTALRLLTDRPPQLETPLEYLRHDLTPNEAFYVRWHLSGIPTRVDLNSYRLRVEGNLKNPLALSLEQLQKDFEAVSVVAINQCSGNQRALFEPRIPGAQWQNGAVGCARWTGVRLKDLLARAQVKPGSVQVSFAGLDTAPSPTVPAFAKALNLGDLDEVLLAYQMNDKPLPMLNGFPLRVVVPGWYATYWVKALSHIQVLDHEFEGFWMKTAYRIPNNPEVNESPDNLFKDTVPINKMKVHSFFVSTAPGDAIPRGKACPLQGLVTHGGGEVKSVEVSVDDGKTWQPAQLEKSQGHYAWRRWNLPWTPAQSGPTALRVRATMASGETQQEHQWNRSGYARNSVERVEVVVV